MSLKSGLFPIVYVRQEGSQARVPSDVHLLLLSELVVGPVVTNFIPIGIIVIEEILLILILGPGRDFDPRDERL